MLSNHRIPMTELEEEAVSRLIKKHGDTDVSITRNDPGETGPVRLSIGDQSWLVEESGHSKKVSS